MVSRLPTWNCGICAGNCWFRGSDAVSASHRWNISVRRDRYRRRSVGTHWSHPWSPVGLSIVRPSRYLGESSQACTRRGLCEMRTCWRKPAEASSASIAQGLTQRNSAVVWLDEVPGTASSPAIVPLDLPAPIGCPPFTNGPATHATAPRQNIHTRLPKGHPDSTSSTAQRTRLLTRGWRPLATSSLGTPRPSKRPRP